LSHPISNTFTDLNIRQLSILWIEKKTGEITEEKYKEWRDNNAEREASIILLIAGYITGKTRTRVQKASALSEH